LNDDIVDDPKWACTRRKRDAKRPLANRPSSVASQISFWSMNHKRPAFRQALSKQTCNYAFVRQECLVVETELEGPTE